MKNSRHIGKKLEWWFREIRSYLNLQNHLSFHKLQGSQQITSRSGSQKLLILDFHSIAIDNVGGRYLYHIIQEFLALGYLPCYRNRFRFIANMESKGFKKHLLELDHIIFSAVSQLDAIGKVTAIISDHVGALDASSAAHKIYINYDLKQASGAEVPLTFGPSPILLRDGLFSDFIPDFGKKRLNTIFFAGRTREQEYGRDLLEKNYGMMNRVKIINTIEAKRYSGASIPQTQVPDSEWEKEHKILLVRNDVCKIPVAKWMNLMRESDFFLACPGSEMPMCHNLVEALAAGSIPILEYPDYLHPGLTHEENCIAFHGPEELLEMIQRALNMPAAEKEQLKRNAYQFYLQHCQPSCLAKALLAQPESTLVMNDYRVKRRP